MNRVSVIIPCYKQGHWLAEAIDSVLAQSKEAEIIVVNDGSPDDTSNVAASYGARVILIEQANQGVAAARNRGLARASGDLLIPLDADDRLKPNYLEVLLREFNDADRVWFAPAVEMFGEVNAVKRPVPNFSLAQLLLRNPLHPTSAFSRRMWEDVGPYDEKMIRAGWEDWDFWIRAFRRGWRPICWQEPLIDYRTRAGSMAIQALEQQQELMRYMVAKHHELYMEALPELMVLARDGGPEPFTLAKHRLKNAWRLPRRAAGYVLRRLRRFGH